MTSSDTSAGMGELSFVGRAAIDGAPQYIHRDVRRIWCVDNLPMPRAFLVGRRWRSAFGVQQRPITEVKPPWLGLVSERRRWVLVFTLEEDVRDLVRKGFNEPEELRPGVFAEW